MILKQNLVSDAVIIVLILIILLTTSKIGAHSEITVNNNPSHNLNKIIVDDSKPLQKIYSVVTNRSSFVPLLPKESLANNVHIPLSSAVTIAERSTGKNLSATLGMLYAEKGFISYIVFITDNNNTMYRILVNPVNGSILSSQHFPILYGALPFSISRGDNVLLHSFNNKESEKPDLTHDPD